MTEENEIVGRFRRDEADNPHHFRWNQALNRALAQIDESGDYTIDLEVTVSKNPGHIDEYRVILTKKTRP